MMRHKKINIRLLPLPFFLTESKERTIQIENDTPSGTLNEIRTLKLRFTEGGRELWEGKGKLQGGMISELNLNR